MSDNSLAVPPQDLEAEMSLLGAMFLENDTIPFATEIVSRSDFYLERNAVLFDAMTAMHERKEPSDLVSLPAELKKLGRLEEAGGIVYIESLMRVVPTSANIEHYAKTVKAASVFRELIAVGETLKAMGYRAGRRSPAEVLDLAQKKLSSVNVGLSERHGQSVSELGPQFRQRLLDIRKNGSRIVGLRTGFRQLDDMTGGWQGQRQYIIAGSTSIGKSAASMGFVVTAAAENRGTVMVFSMEMDKWEVMARFAAPFSDLNLKTFEIPGRWSEYETEYAMDGVAKVEALPIHVDDDRDLSVIQIRHRARAVHRKTPLSMIVIDHLHLIRPEDDRKQRRDQLREMVTHTRQTAQILNVPVLLLCQLSRKPGEREDKRPLLSDLYESGAIEQGADLVGFIHRPAYYRKQRLLEAHEDVNAEAFEEDAEFIVAKQRSGRRGAIRMGFYPTVSHFVELDFIHAESGVTYERTNAGNDTGETTEYKARAYPD